MSQPESTRYELRDLTRAEDLELLEDIQKRAWNYDDREVTPGSLMVASIHTGGIVVGAYPTNSDIPVGFAYSFAAVKGPKSWQHSHMLAITPEHRGTGLATALKLRQRERALELGFTLMTGTRCVAAFTLACPPTGSWSNGNLRNPAKTIRPQKSMDLEPWNA
jgi:predicted GNAT superfamily acetyltransferase